MGKTTLIASNIITLCFAILMWQDAATAKSRLEEYKTVARSCVNNVVFVINGERYVCKQRGIYYP